MRHSIRNLQKLVLKIPGNFKASNYGFPVLSKPPSNQKFKPKDSRESANIVIPIKKEDLLSSYKFSKLSVTDILPKFCEVRFYYYLTNNIKENSPAAYRGSKIHERLERNVNGTVQQAIHDTIPAHKILKRLYSTIYLACTLLARSEVREFYVYDMYKGVALSGIIDLLQIRDGKLVVTDTKTRSSPTLPRPQEIQNAKLQVFLYHRMLSNLKNSLVDFDQWCRTCSADPEALLPDFFQTLWGLYKPESTRNQPWLDSRIESAKNLNDIQKIATALMSMFPELSNTVKVEYVCETPEGDLKTIDILEYDVTGYEPVLTELLNSGFDFWKGKRLPLGVRIDELGKCNNCKWKYSCEWRHKTNQVVLR